MGIKVFLIMIFLSIILSGCNLYQPIASTPTLEQSNDAQLTTPAPPNQQNTPVKKTATVELNDQSQAASTLEVTQTPEPTATPLPYSQQLGSPQYLPAFTHPEAGCNWVGIAGQVFDSRANPLENVTVVVKGYFDGKPVNGLALSGLGKAYGPGGFEVKLGDKALKTQGVVTVQLFNDQFEPLSRLYQVDTYNDCQKNLIIFNFQGIMVVQNLYLPLLSH